MKKLIIICLLMFQVFFCSNAASAENNNFKSGNAIGEVLDVSKGRVVTSGVKVECKSNKKLDNKVLSLLDRMKVKLDSNLKSVDLKSNNYITFKSNRYTGYIESTKDEDINIVTIEIREDSDKDMTKEIKNEISSVLDGTNVHNRYYEYLIAKLPKENLYRLNESIINYIKTEGAQNISTVKIKSGFSTVAYTMCYDAILNNGKLMDLNYAVCRYTSGNYIVIGTPEIVTSY